MILVYFISSSLRNLYSILSLPSFQHLTVHRTVYGGSRPTRPVDQLLCRDHPTSSLMISDGRKDHRDNGGHPVFADDTVFLACQQHSRILISPCLPTMTLLRRGIDGIKWSEEEKSDLHHLDRGHVETRRASDI